MEKLNQMEAAKRGIVTDEMTAVAKYERRDAEWIRERVANGRIVVPANKLHTSLKPMGIGRKLKTKINEVPLLKGERIVLQNNDRIQMGRQVIEFKLK